MSLIQKYCAHWYKCKTCKKGSLCPGWEEVKDQLRPFAEETLKNILIKSTPADEKKRDSIFKTSSAAEREEHRRTVIKFKQLILLSTSLVLNKKNAVITEVERHLKTTDASKFDHVTQLLIWNYYDSTDNNLLLTLHEKLKRLEHIEVRRTDASRLGTISFEKFKRLQTLSIYDITDKKEIADVHDKLKSLTYVIHDEDGTLLWKWESDKQNETKKCITLFYPDKSMKMIPKECSENATTVSLHNLTNGEAVALLKPFAKMERLNIADSPDVAAENISLADVIKRIPKTLTLLHTVEIDETSVDAKDLTDTLNLGGLPMKKLHIKRATNMSDDEVEKLQGSQNVIQVDVDEASTSLNDVLMHYDMDPSRAGICAIFNNEIFDDRDNRSGSTVDADMLHKTFEMFGYVVEIHNNKTGKEMKSILKELSETYNEVKNHNYCSVVVCVLSHGDDKGFVEGRDGGKVNKVTDIYDTFNNENCEGLRRKPRIFIFQCCRGDQRPSSVHTDSPNNGGNNDNPAPGILPEMSDFLIATPSTKECVAVRYSDRGSPYIQTLCKYLRNYGAETDICRVLTAVQWRLHTREYSDEEKTCYTMMPEHTSALTKLLKFKKKEQ